MVRIVSKPFSTPTDWPQATSGLCNTFLCIVATPDFCLTQCLEYLSWLSTRNVFSNTFKIVCKRTIHQQQLPNCSIIFLPCLILCGSRVPTKQSRIGLQNSVLWLEKLWQWGFTLWCLTKQICSINKDSWEIILRACRLKIWLAALLGILWPKPRTLVMTSTRLWWRLGNVLRLHCPRWSDTRRWVCFCVMCIGNIHAPAPAPNQTASAQLESSSCILSN